jgi:hypothetical protein
VSQGITEEERKKSAGKIIHNAKKESSTAPSQHHDKNIKLHSVNKTIELLVHS